METQKIVMLKSEVCSTFSETPSVYTFRSSKKHHWLQRLCFKILDRIGAHKVICTKTIRYGPFNQAKLKNKIYNAITSINKSFDHKDLVIVLGQSQYRELVEDKAIEFPFDFNVDIEYTVRDGMYISKGFVGVPVLVVPWIDGVCVVPKVYIVGDNNGKSL